MNLLDALKDESYEVAVGPLITTPVLRRKVKAMPQVVAIQEALRAQLLNDDDLKRFVNGLMASFRPGKRFPFDVALASLAVLLEARPTQFAGEFLSTLAGLHMQEMPTSTRVARESLAEHRKLPQTTRREVQFAGPAFEFRVLPDQVPPSRRILVEEVRR
jgi:hypothetical protein